MVKCEKSPIEPPSLVKARQKGTKDGYRGEDVIQQLRKDFHNKCYICETPKLQDPEVEHLVPHKGNLDLMLDWHNLFWSCGLCNGVKNQRKYDGKIIDCCREDPEEHICCQYREQNVAIHPLDTEEKSIMTAELITEVFNLRNTGMRTVRSAARMEALQKEMNIFYNELARYEQNKTPVNKRRVVVRLRRSSAYAAFKRSYIRDNPKYKELQEYVS